MAGHLACIFGTSGVGKSFLVREFVSNHESCKELRASELLSKITRQAPEELRTADSDEVASNQKRLAKAVLEVRRLSPTNYLLDGHCVIDNGAELVPVEIDIVMALKPTVIILIHDEPEAIINKIISDKSKRRSEQSPSRIRQVQDLSMHLCREYAEAIDIPFELVKAGDKQRFAAVVEHSFSVLQPIL